MNDEIIRYKTIKIPEPTYEAIKKAQIEIAKVGMNNIPSDILEKCPFCESNLDTIGINYQYSECPNCHYKNQNININSRGNLTIGILVGLGIAALISALGRQERIN